MDTFRVIVKDKTPNHPFFNQGSKFGYVIDGVGGPTLNLERGKTYTFTINAKGHPFYLTTDDTGGRGFPGSLMGKGGPGAKPTDQGVITYTVPSDFPDNAFYQCGVHPKMGGYITINDNHTNNPVVQTAGNRSAVQLTTNPVASTTTTAITTAPITTAATAITTTPTTVPVTSSTTNNSGILVTQKWSGLVAPIDLTYAPGDLDHYYIADQVGLIYRVTKSRNSIEVFLDIRSYVPVLNPVYDERGVFGMAFHPEFIQEGPNKGRFFIFYSSIVEGVPTEGERMKTSNDSYYNCLSEFRWDGNRVLIEQEIVMIRILRNLGIHNGGKIALRAEPTRVLLYLTVGDGGPQKDPENKGQRLDTLEGKILRLDVSPERPATAILWP